MPASSILLQAESLWQSSNWWLNEFADSTLTAPSSSVTPRDPTTLSLALIGITTLAIYSLVRRWPRSRGTVVLERAREEAAGELPAIAEETPSRGAA